MPSGRGREYRPRDRIRVPRNVVDDGEDRKRKYYCTSEHQSLSHMSLRILLLGIVGGTILFIEGFSSLSKKDPVNSDFDEIIHDTLDENSP